MAQLAPLTIDLDGLTPAYSAVNAQDKVQQPSDQRLFLHVKNGGGVSTNVTINAQQAYVTTPEVGRLALTDMVVAIPAGEERMIGPFPPAYVDANGDVVIDYSATASVTAKAFKLPRV